MRSTRDAVTRSEHHADPGDLYPGFHKVVSISEIRETRYALTPGRYVGSSDTDDFDEPFETRFPKLVADVEEHLRHSAELAAIVVRELRRVSNGR